MTDKTDYESMTVPELKDLADKRGIEIFHDARKAEIISALEASDVLLKPEAKEGDKREKKTGQIYNFNISSTVEAPMTHEDYNRLKLTA